MSTCWSCTITTPDPRESAGSADVVVVEHEVEVVGADEVAGRSTEQHRLDLGAGPEAARQVDQVAQRDAHANLVDARTCHGTRQAEEHR